MTTINTNTQNTINTMTNNEEETTTTTTNAQNTINGQPCIEVTGLILSAMAYNHPTNRAADGGKDMFGIIFQVATKAPNPYKFGGNTSIKINVPMNNNGGLRYMFACLTKNVKEIRFDNKEIKDYVYKGIRLYLRGKEVTEKYGDEYYANEHCEIEIMDEPIYMDELPEVPVIVTKTYTSTRTGRKPIR